MYIYIYIPSLKLTYPLKIDAPWKWRFVLETTILRGELLVLGGVDDHNKTRGPCAIAISEAHSLNATHLRKGSKPDATCHG